MWNAKYEVCAREEQKLLYRVGIYIFNRNLSFKRFDYIYILIIGTYKLLKINLKKRYFINQAPNIKTV